MTTRPATNADDHTVVVPDDIQALILNAARGSKQRRILEDIANGKPIRIDDYTSGKWAYATFRSVMSVVERLRQQGVVIAEGEFGPRGGKRWRFHPNASMAITANDPNHLKDFAMDPDPVVRAAVASNPNIPEAAQALLAVDSYPDVLEALACNPNVAGPVLETLAKENLLPGVIAALIDNPATPTSVLEYLATGAHALMLTRREAAFGAWVERQDDRTKALAQQLRRSDEIINEHGIRGLIPLIKELSEEPATQIEPPAYDEAQYGELGDRAAALTLGEEMGGASFVAAGATQARAVALRREAEKLTTSSVNPASETPQSRPGPALGEVIASLHRTADENERARDRDTAAQVRERRLEALHTLVEELRNSDDYLAALRFQKALRTYSMFNTHVLLLQCAERGIDPSLIMGAKGKAKLKGGEPVRDAAGYREVIKPGWNAYGRTIKKGERALWVLGPVTVKADPEEAEKTGQDYKVVGFKPMPVFAYEQTEGEPLPPTLLPRYMGREAASEAEIRDWRSALEGEIRNRGFEVEYGDSGQADGYTSFRENKVVIDAEMAPADQLNTLAHELGHIVCGHGDADPETRHRGTQEVEAESVAFLLCDEAGLDTSEFSMEYIVGWDSASPKALAATGDRVIKVVDEIVAEGPIAELIAKRDAETDVERRAEPAPTFEPTPAL